MDQDETLLFDPENTTVDIILDCVDAIIEINKDRFVTGWRLLWPFEELDPRKKIYNLPLAWTQRLGKDIAKASESSSPMAHLAGENPYLHLKKDISQFYPDDENEIVPDENGSVFRYERVYFVKWGGLGIAEATWERACDLRDDSKIQQFMEYNTIPSSLLTVYGDYLAENYIGIRDDNVQMDIQPATSTSKQDDEEEDGEKRKRLGRPRKSDSAPRQRSVLMRLLVDLNPPQISKG